MKQFEKLQNESSQLVDNVIDKLEDTQESINNLEEKVNSGLKQAANTKNKDSVEHDELEDAVAKLDKKISQLKKDSDNHVKLQFKTLEDSLNNTTTQYAQKFDEITHNLEGKLNLP